MQTWYRVEDVIVVASSLRLFLVYRAIKHHLKDRYSDCRFYCKVTRSRRCLPRTHARTHAHTRRHIHARTHTKNVRAHAQHTPRMGAHSRGLVFAGRAEASKSALLGVSSP